MPTKSVQFTITGGNWTNGLRINRLACQLLSYSPCHTLVLVLSLVKFYFVFCIFPCKLLVCFRDNARDPRCATSGRADGGGAWAGGGAGAGGDGHLLAARPARHLRGSRQRGGSHRHSEERGVQEGNSSSHLAEIYRQKYKEKRSTILVLLFCHITAGEYRNQSSVVILVCMIYSMNNQIFSSKKEDYYTILVNLSLFIY